MPVCAQETNLASPVIAPGATLEANDRIMKWSVDG